MTEYTVSLEGVRSICIRMCFFLNSAVGNMLSRRFKVEENVIPVAHTYEPGKRIVSGMSRITFTSFMDGISEKGYWIQSLTLTEASHDRLWFQIQLSNDSPPSGQCVSMDDMLIIDHMCKLHYDDVAVWRNPAHTLLQPGSSLHIVCLRSYTEGGRSNDGDTIEVTEIDAVFRKRAPRRFVHPSFGHRCRMWRSEIDGRLESIKQFS